MSEELEVDVTPSPIEQQATEQGWKPKEQYVESGGDEANWRPAQEFVDRGELFAKIEDVKRENRNLKKTMTDFKQHHDKVRETEYKRALEELKRDKKQALLDGDADQVIEIDEKMAEAREASRQPAPQVPQEAELNPDFVRWTERNKWYSKDPELKVFADRIGFAVRAANPNLSAQDILFEVEKTVKKANPEKFVNKNKEVAAAVEGGTPQRKAKTEQIELTEEEQKTMRKFVKAGALTEEQYMADIKAMRGVK
ncbi:MAG: hypothetical protein NUV80_06435 [Candidatus Berkelbacteria bacterium]|nr:hypothetical protein [Candidatus Berkelbacteria bacterium]